MSLISDRIREYVTDLSVSNHYGSWGALRPDQRRQIRELCDACDMFEKTADEFFAENESQKAEIEKLNVELAGMRGACESYKMHYDNSQAEIERLQEENKIKSQKRANIFEILNAYERGRAEASKEFAERLRALFSELNKYDRLHVYEILDRIDIVEEEMVGESDV